MTKKVLALLLAFVLIFGLAACGGSTEPAAPAESETFEFAMITDIGSIDDKSFNQGTWEGVVAYAEANGITHKYYKPTEQSTDAYMAAIQLAVEGGAKVIVTPGFLFEEPIYLAQDLYPEVTFILIDGNPHNADYSEFKTADNAVGIVFAEEQSGSWLAMLQSKTATPSLDSWAVWQFPQSFVSAMDSSRVLTQLRRNWASRTST